MSASSTAAEDPNRKADLTEMHTTVLDEIEHLEIVDRAMGQYQCQLGGRDRRRMVVLRQVANLLQLVQAHEREFADLIRAGRRSGGRSGS